MVFSLNECIGAGSRECRGRAEGSPDRCATRGTQTVRFPPFGNRFKTFRREIVRVRESSRLLSRAKFKCNSRVLAARYCFIVRIAHLNLIFAHLVVDQVVTQYKLDNSYCLKGAGISEVRLRSDDGFKVERSHCLPCACTTVRVDCEVQNGRCGSARSVKPATPRARTAALPHSTLALPWCPGLAARSHVARLLIQHQLESKLSLRPSLNQ